MEASTPAQTRKNISKTLKDQNKWDSAKLLPVLNESIQRFTFERDHRQMAIESSVIPTTFIFVSAMLQKAMLICGKLIVSPDRMLENLNLLKGLNLSETVATALASRGLGRYTAHGLMREIAQSVMESGKEFRDLLKNHEIVRRYLSEAEIDEYLDF
jgi:adenylosuccinate lyase